MNTVHYRHNEQLNWTELLGFTFNVCEALRVCGFQFSVFIRRSQKIKERYKERFLRRGSSLMTDLQLLLRDSWGLHLEESYFRAFAALNGEFFQLQGNFSFGVKNDFACVPNASPELRFRIYRRKEEEFRFSSRIRNILAFFIISMRDFCLRANSWIFLLTI